MLTHQIAKFLLFLFLIGRATPTSATHVLAFGDLTAAPASNYLPVEALTGAADPLPPVTPLLCTGNSTTEMWLFMGAYPASPWAPFSIVGINFDTTGEHNAGGSWRINPTGEFVLFGEIATGANTLNPFGTIIPLQTWTHVSLVRTPTVSHLYINGVYNSTVTTGTVCTDARDAGLSWGGAFRRFITTGLVSCAFSEFRLWDYARSPAQIASTWATRIPNTGEPGLLVRYAFDSPPGALAELDRGSLGGHINLSPCPSSTAGPVSGSHAVFLGGTRHIRASAPITPLMFGNMTVEFWIKLRTVSRPGSSWNYPLVHYGGDANVATAAENRILALSIVGGSLKVLAEKGVSTDVSVLFPLPPSMLGRWTHIAVSRNTMSGTITLHIDGALNGTASYGSPPMADSATSGAFWVGASKSSNDERINYSSDFSVYDLRVWNTVLTTAEINYPLPGPPGPPPPPPALVLHWKLDSPDPCVVLDSSASANHGLANMTELLALAGTSLTPHKFLSIPSAQLPITAAAAGPSPPPGTVPFPPPPPPTPPPPPAPPLQPVRVIDPDRLPSSPAASSGSIALYLAIAAVAVALVVGHWSRSHNAGKYAAHPDRWLGLSLSRMILATHMLTSLCVTVPDSPIPVAARLILLYISLAVQVIIAAVFPLIKSDTYDSDDALFSLDRAADAALATVIAILITAALGVPALKYTFRKGPGRPRSVALALSAAAAVVISGAVAVVFLLPRWIESVPWKPATVLIVAATSFALNMLFQPLQIAVIYTAVGVRAVRVLAGGNGGSLASLATVSASSKALIHNGDQTHITSSSLSSASDSTDLESR